MCINYLKFASLRIDYLVCVSLISLALNSGFTSSAEDQKAFIYKIKPDDLIASTQAKDVFTFEKVAGNFVAEQKQLGTELLNILKDSKSSNLSLCSAAYYLGELRSPEAAEALAAKITLQLDLTSYMIRGIPVIAGDPAVKALIKIGNPSIPCVIHNLEESDDSKVRELSLKVLNGVEGDKDAGHLRLQKAINAQPDSKKKTRLQDALQIFIDPKFGK